MRRLDLRLPTESLRIQRLNKSTSNDGRSVSQADFFTVGYSGQKLDHLIVALKDAGVVSLIDIRHNPVSMYRPEMSKSNLRRSLDAEGIAYWHERDLGVPRDVRALAVGETTRDSIWRWYDLNVVSTFAGKNLHWFFNAVEHPAALMCTELDPTSCHRHLLAEALESHGLMGFEL